MGTSVRLSVFDDGQRLTAKERLNGSKLLAAGRCVRLPFGFDRVLLPPREMPGQRRMFAAEPEDDIRDLDLALTPQLLQAVRTRRRCVKSDSSRARSAAFPPAPRADKTDRATGRAAQAARPDPIESG